MSISPQQWIRYIGQGLSGLLILPAIWLPLAEISRPRPTFPTDAATALLAASGRNDAKWAARFGIVRGDLWTESALTYSDLFWSEERGSEKSREMMALARSVAERALAYSPHDARAWLLLASFELPLDGLNGRSAAALKMSYYTGPNKAELTPMRLLVSLRSATVDDDEIRQLVKREIRTVIADWPDLKPVLVLAYRSASPAGKRFLESTLEELDPKLLATIRAKNAGQQK